MAAAKKDEGSKSGQDEVVLVPFAYARAKSGEVVALGKGPFDAGRFVEGSETEGNTLAYLRSIGFIGVQD